MSYEFKSTIDGFKSTSCEFKSTSYEFKFTKEAPIQSITDIALLGFSLILLPGMFISYCTIIYFFVYIYIYIYIYIFECLYFSEYDIPMFLFVFWLRNRPSIKYVRRQGNGGGHPKGGERYHASCVRTHLHYLFSCFCHMVSCFVCSNLGLRHIVQYISAIVFKKFFWNNPTA